MKAIDITNKNKDLDLRRFGKNQYTDATNSSEGESESNIIAELYQEIFNSIIEAIQSQSELSPEELDKLILPNVLFYDDYEEEYKIINPNKDGIIILFMVGGSLQFGYYGEYNFQDDDFVISSYGFIGLVSNATVNTETIGGKTITFFTIPA